MSIGWLDPGRRLLCCITLYDVFPFECAIKMPGSSIPDTHLNGFAFGWKVKYKSNEKELS